MTAPRHSQRAALVYAALLFLLVIVVVQIWLLSGTMETYLAGVETIAGPACLLSAVCFAAAVWIVGLILRFEQA